MSQQPEEQRAHAKLSASGAYRWSTCTKAPQLEEQFPESSSSYAIEGTLAHSLGEHCLIHNVRADEVEGEYPDEMRDYVQEYVDYVTAIPGTRFTEVRVNFSHVVPEGFGTADAIVIQGRTIHVVDLKYGKGIKVEADGPQGKLYAVGAIRDFGYLMDGIDKIVLHIVQPRLNHVGVHEMTEGELSAFMEWIAVRAKMAWAGEGDFVAGDHCGFCKAKAVCKARAEQNLRIAREEFSQPCPNPQVLTLDEIAELLPQLDQISSWCSAVQTYALEQAMAGNKPTGFKVVEGRSIRKWGDEGQVTSAMHAAGLTDDQIYTKKLIGIGETEKLLGKKSEIFTLAVRATGRPTLVPEADKRPEMNRSQAMADFSDDA